MKFTLVSTLLVFGCSSPAFDIGDQIDPPDTDVADTDGDGGVVRDGGGDTGKSDSGDPSETITVVDSGAVDTSPSTDTTSPPADSGSLDTGAEVHCSRYCWKTFGTTPLGDACSKDSDCCSTSCDSVGVGATHTCIAPEGAGSNWCGPPEEWCPTFTYAECVP